MAICEWPMRVSFGLLVYVIVPAALQYTSAMLFSSARVMHIASICSRSAFGFSAAIDSVISSYQ